jgi:4-hydroxyacetophenone monooxygenase
MERITAIADDDEAVAAALADANPLCLAAAVVHMSGDSSILRGPIRPRRFGFNEFEGGLDADECDELRRLALPVVLAHRDAGSPQPVTPEAVVLRELMDWLACEHVSDEYAEMLLDELDFPGDDPRAIAPPDDVTDLTVLVIGCGMSGILAGVRLAQAGIDFEIIEKNDDAGGTWYENDYPGCRVDVGNHYYCYSFEPNYDFSEYFSRQPELHAYFRDVMVRHGVDRHVRWRTEVERAEWDDDSQVWRVTVRLADGSREVRTVNAVISAVGQLNRPSIPDLPNLGRFAGPVFHSARWDHAVDLRGKRVGLVGAGASGFQIGPAIADDAASVVVFQRSAQWMLANANYRRSVEPGSQWAMHHLPGYALWYRFMLLWQASDKMLDIARVDPTWPGLPQSANAASEHFRNLLVRWIETQLDGHPGLAHQVTPDYPPLGKRLLQDDGTWLRFLRRDDVELVTGPIDDVEEHAVVADGRRHEVDVLIMATGFRANDFLHPMEIVGRNGVRLNDAWEGKPAAYLGISIPAFPNLFLMYGPGTNLAHAGSVVFHSECQLRYIGNALALLASSGGGSIEPTAEAFDEYVARWQHELSQTVWAHPSVGHSWYRAADGNVYVLSPWRLVDYWNWTAAPEPAAHVVRNLEGGSR